jgi:hypothetical protein
MIALSSCGRFGLLFKNCRRRQQAKACGKRVRRFIPDEIVICPSFMTCRCVTALPPVSIPRPDFLPRPGKNMSILTGDVIAQALSRRREANVSSTRIWGLA